MNDINIASTSAPTSLAIDTSSLIAQFPTYASCLKSPEVVCTTTDDSEMSSDEEIQLPSEEPSSFSNVSAIENAIDYSPYQSSLDATDDASWSSIESSTISLTCGADKSSSEFSEDKFVLNSTPISSPTHCNETIPDDLETPILILVEVLVKTSKSRN